MKRGDLVLFDGGKSGNKLSGIVLKVELFPADWKGKSGPVQRYATIHWQQTGSSTIMPVNYEGLYVLNEGTKPPEKIFR